MISRHAWLVVVLCVLVSFATGCARAPKQEVGNREESRSTPVHWAARWGDAEEARRLLEAGADVNARDQGGMTPLHWAARKGQLELAQLLVEHGADVNAADNKGATPLHWAAEGEPEVVRLLLEAGADVNVTSKDGWTPLLLAKYNEDTEVADLLRAARDTKPRAGVDFLRGLKEAEAIEAKQRTEAAQDAELETEEGE